METEKKYDVFVSWSGDCSKSVALLLKDFIEKLHPEIRVFVSTFITKGTTDIVELESAMNAAACGIACVTKRNRNNPWLLYECGYVKAKTGMMCPLLVDFSTEALPEKPLALMQCTWPTKEDFTRLMKDILKKTQLSDKGLADALNLYWEAFAEDLSRLVAEGGRAASSESENNKTSAENFNQFCPLRPSPTERCCKEPMPRYTVAERNGTIRLIDRSKYVGLRGR